MSAPHVIDRIVSEVDRAADEIVHFTADLVRIPTINPPGEAYEPCARVIGDRLMRSDRRLASPSSTPCRRT